MDCYNKNTANFTIRTLQTLHTKEREYSSFRSNK